MCITGANTMTAMDTDEDDKFEAQVAKYNVHFKNLMNLIPISQHEFDSDDEDNGMTEENDSKKGKHNPPGGKYGSKVSKKQKNQYKVGMTRADAIKTKRLARKQSKSKGRKAKAAKAADGQDKPKGKPDKYKGKQNRFKGKN